MWNSKFNIDMIRMINPTSKASLKQQCMIIAQGDVKKAKELYEFYAEGLELPDFDPVQPSSFESFKDNFLQFMGWIKDNQSTVAQGADFIRGLFSKNAVQDAEEVEDLLPPINQ